MAGSTGLTSSMEDYLEAILVLGENGEPVRITDIARRLGIAKASVSQAVSVLKTSGLVEQEPYGRVSLTSLGRDSARKVTRRHTIVRRLLVEVLGVPAHIADDDACRLEHSISPETLSRLVAFLEKNGRRQDPGHGGSSGGARPGRAGEDPS
ncbi:MAG: metal-dependent transcriptional regulator [Bacillota bacterium]|nr:MAG: metal-dependent transcriptional regulator [Bacillota bacterium]